jgi:tripartite-type tricarboxylate transporter receptor subunit TctC
MKRSVYAVFVSFVLLGLAGCMSHGTVVTSYPERSVTLVVGFPPGSSVDITARHLAAAGSEHLRVPIGVVNRKGDAGVEGMTDVIQAPPDGYTLGMATMELLTIRPHLTRLPYGSPDDYTPVVNVVNSPLCLAVRSNAPWKDIREFIVSAKARPGKARVGDGGAASATHLAVEHVKSVTGVDLVAVHLGGAPECVSALWEGKVDALVQHVAAVLPEVVAERARLLGVFEERRNPLVPDIPTFKEAGYDVILGDYILVIGPPRLPPGIVDRLQEAFRKAMEDRAFINPVELRRWDVFYEGSGDLKRRLWRDYENNGKLVEALKGSK